MTTILPFPSSKTKQLQQDLLSHIANTETYLQRLVNDIAVFRDAALSETQRQELDVATSNFISGCDALKAIVASTDQWNSNEYVLTRRHTNLSTS